MEFRENFSYGEFVQKTVDFLTIPEACAAAGVPETTLREAIAAEILPASRTKGGTILLRPEDLTAWARGRRKVGRPRKALKP